MTHTPQKENLEKEIYKLLHKKHMGENCSKQIEYLKSFVDGLLTAQLQNVVEEIEGMKKTGMHEADIGYGDCKWCGSPMSGAYQTRNVIQRDLDSGGEIGEVTLTQFNISGLPCLSNIDSSHNKAISDTQALLRKIMENKI